MTTVTCLYCGASTSGIGGIHICAPRGKQTTPKKTDEELVEAMCEAGRAAYEDALGDGESCYPAYQISMRAALAVVRGNS